MLYSRIIVIINIILFCSSWAFGATYYINPEAKGGLQTGSQKSPFRSWEDISFSSNNTYLQKRGTQAIAQLELRGVQNVTIGAYGDGHAPILSGDFKKEYGILVVSSPFATIKGIHLAEYQKSCILVIGSPNFLIESNECNDSIYGICVNAGKLMHQGTIRGNFIHDTIGDGIGAWNLNPGISILKNRVVRFGNDGIDILGSVGAIIKGNTVSESIDNVTIGDRGGVHAGIKAGGNKKEGGGWNIIESNEVSRVKNFGIFNRHAVGNRYVNNYCHDNGVNFNFVASDQPSRAYIVGNISKTATYQAGLRYDVFIPPRGDLEHAENNQWSGLVNIKTIGLFSDQESYRKAMSPLEQSTTIQ